MRPQMIEEVIGDLTLMCLASGQAVRDRESLRSDRVDFECPRRAGDHGRSGHVLWERRRGALGGRARSAGSMAREKLR